MKREIKHLTLHTCDVGCGLYSNDVKNLTRRILMRVLDGLRE